MGISEKIKDIESELKGTKYHKGTEHHIGLLKAKLSKLKKQAQSGGKGGGGQGFAVKKSGDSSVALIGFPSVGKSTLLNKLTNAQSEVAAYAFTTVTVIPGVLEYKGARIQVLDMPGILEGASRGMGRGREVIGVARSTDLVIIVLDVFEWEKRGSIIRELEEMGMRLDKAPPKIVVTPKERGGVLISSTVKLTKLDERTIKDVLAVYNLYNGEVLFREDADVDQLIDVLSENRVYLPSLTVLNKVDLVSPEFLNEAKKRLGGFIPISAEKSKGIEELKEAIYSKLRFIRLYLRPKGGEPDFKEPLILRKGSTVEELCDRLHRDLRHEFRHAMVWGPSAKFPGQKVGLTHVLADEDIVTIVKR